MVKMEWSSGMLYITILKLAIYTTIHAKTVDNKLKDTPEVTCGPDKITIAGETTDQFEGVVFIKNWRRSDDCAANYTLNDNSTRPSFSLPLNRIAQCGLEMRRNPDTKELEIFAVFVFSFHPNFVTVGDRSFAVHCIFQQQQVTVATKFSFIADITTRAIIGATAEMPLIKLSIVEGRVPDQQLQPTTLVSVGEALMYIWYMNTESDIYGIRVNECTAEAKDGRKIKIIKDGCSLDPLVVSHVQYSENNQKAFADGLAFKFPDADDVWMTCAVSTCIKQFEHLQVANQSSLHLCQKQTTCNRREKRSSALSEIIPIYSSNDLLNQRIRVMDAPAHALPFTSLHENQQADVTSTVCLNRNAFAGASAALATAYVAIISLAGGLGVSIYHRSQQSKQMIT